MCQLDWSSRGCLDIELNIVSGCVCKGVSGRDEHLSQCTKERGLEWHKKVKEGQTVCLLEPEHLSSPDLGYQNTWFLGLWTPAALILKLLDVY